MSVCIFNVCLKQMSNEGRKKESEKEGLLPVCYYYSMCCSVFPFFFYLWFYLKLKKKSNQVTHICNYDAIGTYTVCAVN